MLLIEVTNAREVVQQRIGKLGARLIGKVVDPEKQVEEALMQEMETAFKEFGIEAKISSVANAQTIGTGLLELPILTQQSLNGLESHVHLHLALQGVPCTSGRFCGPG